MSIVKAERQQFEKATDAASEIQSRKSLIQRINGYADKLVGKANVSPAEEAGKLNWIRKLLLKLSAAVLKATSSALSAINAMLGYVKDLFTTAGNPVSSVYKKIKNWYHGTEPMLQAA